MRASILVGLVISATCAFSNAVEGQKALRDDDRAYSNTIDDRRYVAARCAALYSEIAQSIAVEQPNLASAKSSAAHEFLKRVPNPSKDVFLSWSREYKKQVAKQNHAPRWHSDYEACSGVLALIREGDNLAKYSRDDLRYLMGGDAKAPLK
jgi:hypothetical protein